MPLRASRSILPVTAGNMSGRVRTRERLGQVPNQYSALYSKCEENHQNRTTACKRREMENAKERMEQTMTSAESAKGRRSRGAIRGSLDQERTPQASPAFAPEAPSSSLLATQSPWLSSTVLCNTRSIPLQIHDSLVH